LPDGGRFENATNGFVARQTGAIVDANNWVFESFPGGVGARTDQGRINIVNPTIWGGSRYWSWAYENGVVIVAGAITWANPNGGYAFSVATAYSISGGIVDYSQVTGNIYQWSGGQTAGWYSYQCASGQIWGAANIAGNEGPYPGNSDCSAH
jgi:hypothetical protein